MRLFTWIAIGVLLGGGAQVGADQRPPEYDADYVLNQIAISSGADPENYRDYAGQLSQLLNQFTPAQRERIFSVEDKQKEVKSGEELPKNLLGRVLRWIKIGLVLHR